MFDRAWPSYRTWFLREGDRARPGLRRSRTVLSEHMPELVPVWERLVALADGDRQVARMLTLYRPTPYVSGCSQAVLAGPSPVLVRNYDYHPHACEATFLRSRWLGTTVLASSDCLWGALDGINEHGLAVALSFGGSREVGDGFGIPLILRYVLETAADTRAACAVLRRVPSHMAYNVSVVDARGDHVVAHLRPGGEPEIVRAPVATNHQGAVVWPEYVAATRSVERLRFLERALPRTEDAEALVGRFLEPPLFVRDYPGWHGTLYTAAYHPVVRACRVVWPGASVTQTLDAFTECEFDVPFHERAPEAVGAPAGTERAGG